MTENINVKMPKIHNYGNTQRLHEMIRVDHAGEYAAVQIYRGQKAVFETLPHKRKITHQLAHMEEEEKAHLEAFDKLILHHNIRPTGLMPVWKKAAYTLGIITALLGEKAAHACTEAVEDVIEKHYMEQIIELKENQEQELAATITKFREEEIAHRDLAIEEGARQMPGYTFLSKVIKAGCRAAIRLSEKL